MESLSYLYYSLVFEADTDPPCGAISLPNFLRSAQLRLASMAWLLLAIGLFSLSLQNMALALKTGDRGSEVETLQTTLKTKGYFNGPITGYYGPITAEAVQQFQQVNQLDADGIAGPATQASLYGGEAAKNTINTPLNPESEGLLKYGQNNSQVRQIQEQLQQLGYFQGPTSGYYGTLTETAVKAFQQANGLTADGVVGPETRRQIAAGGQGETPAAQAANAAETANPEANSPFQMEGFTTGGSGLEEALAPTTTLKPQPPGPDADWEAATRPQTISSQAAIATPFARASQRFIAQMAEEQPNIGLAVSFSNGSQRFTADTVPPNRATPATFRQTSFTGEPQTFNATAPSREMAHRKTIYGDIAPKSIVHSGQGLFFAQNMMYNHSITVYDRNYNLVKTIADTVDLQKYGYPQYAGIYRGSPVEASFSHSGQYAWVSNYQMYGTGFNHPGSDQCTPTQGTDSSFLYRINTQNFAIEQVIRVGSVPKFVATTPDDRYVLVTNWCTDDLSVVDVNQGREIKRVKLGRYPRGIVVDARSETAYIAVMGSQHIAKVNLGTFEVGWIRDVGRSPRHLNLDPTGRYLYSSLNGESQVAKIDLASGKVIAKARTGNAPRSMILSETGEFLYVVNYHSNTMTKVRTATMDVMQTVSVNDKPIGITYDAERGEVWVSCYSGSIMIFSA
ncbi:peptidoglycan-binding protein [Spirulina sp. CCNP1310]|uniref:peptidoglycan-binding protein n=1 Tax=Spirulina sp. CCNP1310 TaxID=3110249 RepID=UPI002B21CF5A|nr:peptidoglycan-binding protein [Spirulina sp. CCNP1310]MEA5420649.1 peptidoglycan-binding protein [Spirulina sp. CCNP1310]